MSVLGSLQGNVEELASVSTGLDVRQYLLDPAAWREVPGAREGLPEQLFVREDERGDVELALYVAPEVLGQLERDDPHTRLHAGNFESYCIALEGVSHFVFVAWRAQMGRPVSALELEIQAEVDKFVAAWLLLAKQGSPLQATGHLLARQLFEAWVLRNEVPSDETQRYVLASRVAERYCGQLTSRFGQDRTPSRIKREVRRYYRQSLQEKLRAA